MRRRKLAMIMSALAPLAAYGCGGSSGGTGLDFGGGGGGGGLWTPSCDGIAGKPAGLTLFASDFQAHVGGAVELSVEVVDGTCALMTMDLTNSWSVSPATMGTLEVFPQGGRAHFVPGKIGDVTVTVSKDGFVDRRYIRVWPHVASFTLSPASRTLRVGDSVQVTLVALDAAGKVMQNMPSELNFDWYSPVAEVRTYPTVTWLLGVQPGTYDLNARLFDMRRTSTITVIER